MKSTKDMTENSNSILKDSKIRPGCTMWLLERLSLNRRSGKHASEDRSIGPALINRAPAMTLSALLALTSCFCKTPLFHFFYELRLLISGSDAGDSASDERTISSAN